MESYFALHMWNIFERSSLIYNTSARHEGDECDTSDMNATRIRH